MMDLEPVRQFLLVFGISIARLTAACSITPFMSSRLIQGQIRNSIVFSWGLMVYPIVAPSLDLTDATTLSIVGILIKEVVLGLLVGFMAAKAFWVAMSVGFFIDNQRGASMASVFDPAAGEQTSPIGEFLHQALIAMFYISGGFLVFLGAIFQSYLVWPIGSFFPTFSEAFPGFFLEVLDDLVRTVVVLAAPIIITVFLSEFGLGLMNRFAPQLNVFFLAMPVKSVVALIVMIVYMPILFVLFSGNFLTAQALFNIFEGIMP